jgi:hypothetical protein
MHKGYGNNREESERLVCSRHAELIWLATDAPVYSLKWKFCPFSVYEGVSKSFGTGHLERELQMVQLSATRCSCIAILWVSLVSFAAITFCVASQRLIPKVSVYFVIDYVWKLLDASWYTPMAQLALNVNTSLLLYLLCTRKRWGGGGVIVVGCFWGAGKCDTCS